MNRVGCFGLHGGSGKDGAAMSDDRSCSLFMDDALGVGVAVGNTCH